MIRDFLREVGPWLVFWAFVTALVYLWKMT